jgi:feruloyl esterase
MNTYDRWRTRSLVLAFAGATTAPALAATSCESLATLAFPDTTIYAPIPAFPVTTITTTITDAQELPAGPATIPGTTGPGGFVGSGFSGTLPVAICRVRGTIKPTSVSNIIFEVWMPVSTWNGKFNAVGRGGTAGSLGLNSMVTPVGLGFASAVTDTGHESNDSSFALVSPELIEDFAHRSYHLTTVVGKQIMAAYYGTAPSYSYFTACSTGGAEALSQAQRYPGDYDGIVAGAPAHHYTLMWPGEVWPSWVSQSDPAALITKLPALNAAAVAACDAVDGTVDGIIDDPRKCVFDPATIQCAAGDNLSCLTPMQVSQVKKIYAGFRDPSTGAQIWPPYMIGSEDQWSGHISQNGSPPVNYFRYFVYDNPSWYYTDPAFNMESVATVNDIYAADRKFAYLLDSIDPDLTAFEKMGGKLIMYHGWKDQNIAPLNSINYYENVVFTIGSLKKTQQFARLFMAPGMQHCGGGPGPNTFDSLGALEQWVEHGVAPDEMIATHSNSSGVVDIKRPLCAYPKAAVYKGHGSIYEAASFTCESPGGDD